MRCKGITKKGRQCSFQAKNKCDYCLFHAPRQAGTETDSLIHDTELLPVSAQQIHSHKLCRGKTQTGKNCQRKVDSASLFCFSHRIPKPARNNKPRQTTHGQIIPTARQQELKSQDTDVSDNTPQQRIRRQYVKELETPYTPENILHRPKILENCGVCLDNHKKGLNLSCCLMKQNMCMECIVQYLLDNYKRRNMYNPDYMVDLNPNAPNFGREIMKLSSTLCICPFCRKKKSFKKFNKVLTSYMRK